GFDGSRASFESRLGDLKGSAVWSISGSVEDALWLATSRGLYVLSPNEPRSRAQDGPRSGAQDSAPASGLEGATGAPVAVLEGCDARSVFVVGGNRSRFAWCGTAGAGLYRIRLGDRTIVGRTDAEQGLQ